MKKIAALLVLLAFSITAQANSTFVGLGFANNKMKGELYDDFFNETFTDSITETAFAIKVGRLHDHNRFYADFSRASFDGGDLTSILARHDFLFPMQEQFSLFAGGHAGLAMLSLDEGGNANGLQFGLQLGALIHLSEKAFIDLGYSYSITTIKESFDYQECSNFRCTSYTDYTDTFKINDISGFMISFNMRF